ncbi:uncharacterized protein LOC120511639 [Passer montanus]|uniref:uncharacterized protein LOC120511639 n=1 Tax=Passer montanus TaxID=9160 RepID=UPI00195FBCC5|nr:uncharacterized protein LOC120511639 [Passer montanus]
MDKAPVVMSHHTQNKGRSSVCAVEVKNSCFLILPNVIESLFQPLVNYFLSPSLPHMPCHPIPSHAMAAPRAEALPFWLCCSPVGTFEIGSIQILPGASRPLQYTLPLPGSPTPAGSRDISAVTPRSTRGAMLSPWAIVSVPAVPLPAQLWALGITVPPGSTSHGCVPSLQPHSRLAAAARGSREAKAAQGSRCCLLISQPSGMQDLGTRENFGITAVWGTIRFGNGVLGPLREDQSHAPMCSPKSIPLTWPLAMPLLPSPAELTLWIFINQVTLDNPQLLCRGASPVQWKGSAGSDCHGIIGIIPCWNHCCWQYFLLAPQRPSREIP